MPKDKEWRHFIHVGCAKRRDVLSRPLEHPRQNPHLMESLSPAAQTLWLSSCPYQATSCLFQNLVISPPGFSPAAGCKRMKGLSCGATFIISNTGFEGALGEELDSSCSTIMCNPSPWDRQAPIPYRKSNAGAPRGFLVSWLVGLPGQAGGGGGMRCAP